MNKVVRRVAVAVVAIISVAPSAAQPQPVPSNLGFETRDASGRASAWYVVGDGFGIDLDSVAPLAGRLSLRTRWVSAAPFRTETNRFGVGSVSYPLTRVAGRRLRLTGAIRTEQVTTGYAGLWIRVDGPGGRPLLLDNMATRGAHGTSPWTRYEVELPVDSGATGVFLGVIHAGDGTAWFDSLTLDVIGDPMPRRVVPVKREARPTESENRLLSDAELQVPVDGERQRENPHYAAWVASHARPVRSLAAAEVSDLDFLASILERKRIVQLGESAHGVAEFSMAKVRLIKYLHEKLGFDVIAFESSTYECDRAQKAVAALSALDLMRGCIFAVWHTDEALALFDYVKETQSTPRPLLLAGFDIQTSSNAVLARPSVFRSLIAPLDSDYAARVYLVDSTFLANRDASYAVANQTRLAAFYDSLATFLDAHRASIQDKHPSDSAIAIVARQAALSMTYYVRVLAVSSDTAAYEIRDAGMANNIDFLLNERYPDRKVVIWAHNLHVRRRGFGSSGRTMFVRQSSSDTSHTPLRTMGTWVAERHGSELYTIGLFMFAGSAATNDREPYAIVESRPGSFESILHNAPWRYAFLDFSTAKRERGSEWIWSPVVGLSWGRTPETFVPRDEYDGVLFIDSAHLPHYR